LNAAAKIAARSILRRSRLDTCKQTMTKNDFYRYARLTHGWLSAFAFAALCFFAFTGMLLNHPEWFADSKLTVVNRSFTLTSDEIQRLRTARRPSLTLVEVVSQRMPLKGAIGVGDEDDGLAGDDLFVRTRGARGTSFLRANLATGAVEVTVEEPPNLIVLNELHRGEHAGDSWRFAIDAMAVVLMALSVVGYAIFLSMNTQRLRTAALLTAGGTLGFCMLFAFAVS
jgi:hypothetical protein